MRCTLMRYTPMRCTPVRCTPLRCMPVRCTPMMQAHEVHAYEIHAHEVHARPLISITKCAPLPSRKIRLTSFPHSGVSLQLVIFSVSTIYGFVALFSSELVVHIKSAPGAIVNCAANVLTPPVHCLTT